MSCGSSPKRGNVDHYWLLRRNPLKVKGLRSHSFIRPRLSSSHVINAPLQEFPPTASDVYLGPHEHPLRRAALCLIVILDLLVLLQVARPLRSAEGCCGGRIRGIVLLAHSSCNSGRRKIHRIQRLRHLLARPDISALKTAASSNRPDIQ